MSDSNEAPKFPAIRALDDPTAWDGRNQCHCAGYCDCFNIQVAGEWVPVEQYRELLKSEFLAVGTAQAAALREAQEIIQLQRRLIEKQAIELDNQLLEALEGYPGDAN